MGFHRYSSVLNPIDGLLGHSIFVESEANSNTISIGSTADFVLASPIGTYTLLQIGTFLMNATFILYDESARAPLFSISRGVWLPVTTCVKRFVFFTQIRSASTLDAEFAPSIWRRVFKVKSRAARTISNDHRIGDNIASIKKSLSRVSCSYCIYPLDGVSLDRSRAIGCVPTFPTFKKSQ